MIEPIPIPTPATANAKAKAERPALGSFDELNVFYQDLMNDHIKPTLIWYSCVEYIPFSGIQFKSEGALKYRTEQGESPSKSEIDYLLNKAMNSADFYSTRTQNYLISYSNQIPQYLESVGNLTQVFPDFSNQYFGGLQL